MLKPNAVIGIIGGGQLGRMMSMAAATMGYKVHIMTLDKDSPAAQVSYDVTIADYNDEKSLDIFASKVDIVTFEFENIPYQAIKYLSQKVLIYPNWNAIYIAQNRIREKQFLQNIGIKTAQFEIINKKNCESERKCIAGILKSAEQGYDGKWQYFISDNSQIASFVKDNIMILEWILEAFVEFEKELSIVVARNSDGRAECFPVAENHHLHGILHISKISADINESVHDAMQFIATKIAKEINLIGVMGVEFFYLRDGSLLVNEIAPRPHNSAHWSIDACNISQFQQHIRAICGLPLIKVKKHFDCMMQNLLGEDVLKLNKYLNDPNARLHLYGKNEIKEKRKMGHVNIITS